MTLALVPSTIQVSGYPAVQATAWMHNGLRVGTATDSFALHGLNMRAERVAHSVRGALSDYARCESCLRWLPRVALDGHRVGVTSYCPDCVAVLESQCRERWIRLPVPGVEFFCPACLVIALVENRAPKDLDGRTRNICAKCRAEQVAAAGKRRALHG